MTKKRGKSAQYNFTKHHLINYRFYQATIERRERRLEEIVAQMEGLSATDYSRDRIQSNPGPGSMIEKLIAEKIQIEDELRRAKALVADIDRAMMELDDEEQIVIRMKYIDRCSIHTTWQQVARQMGYDKRTCERRRDSAIEKISVVIYGIS